MAMRARCRGAIALIWDVGFNIGYNIVLCISHVKKNVKLESRGSIMHIEIRSIEYKPNYPQIENSLSWANEIVLRTPPSICQKNARPAENCCAIQTVE